MFLEKSQEMLLSKFLTVTGSGSIQSTLDIYLPSAQIERELTMECILLLKSSEIQFRLNEGKSIPQHLERHFVLLGSEKLMLGSRSHEQNTISIHIFSVFSPSLF